jgi:hypothetical protein
MVIQTAMLLWVVGALAGSMVFFAIVVAPRVFQSLPPDQPGVFLRSLSPGYSTWGLLLATASALIAMWSQPERFMRASARSWAWPPKPAR